MLRTTPRDADRGDDPRLGAGCERSTIRCRGVSPAAKRPGSPAMKNPLRGSLRFDLTKNSERAVTRKMRLPALVACSAVVVNALAPTKVRALCRTTSSGQIELIQKRTRLNRRAKHTIESLYTPEKLPTHRPEHLHRAHDLLERNAQNKRSRRRPRPKSCRHNAVTRRSRRARPYRRTATTPSRAPRSPRSTRTRPTRCARPSRNYQTSSSRPSWSASRTTSLSSSKSSPRLYLASSSALRYGAWTAATRLF